MPEPELIPDENLDNHDDDGGAGGEGGEGDKSKDSKGGEGDETPKVKIGDKEYTVEELTGLLGKANQYDELLPEFTKKSQALAALTGGKKEGEGDADDKTPWLKPGWKPKTFDELKDAIIWARDSGKTEALKTLEDQQTAATKTKAEIDGFFAEVKKSDKDFDDADFSNFVLEHTKEKEDVTVTDLKMLYSVYKDLDKAVNLGEGRARENMGRRTERVNREGGGGPGKGTDFTDLRAGGGGIRDIAKSALERLSGDKN